MLLVMNSVSRKKETKMFFCNIFYKTRAILLTLVHRFLNKFAAKWYKCFTPHLNNITTLPCESWNADKTRCYHWVVTGRNSRIYCTSIVAPKFARFESSWLEHVAIIEREGVQNMHHWSERTETATENGVGQFGSRRRCSIHLSVALLIAPDQWCVFCAPYLAVFPTCCYQLDSNLAKLEETVKVG